MSIHTQLLIGELLLVLAIHAPLPTWLTERQAELPVVEDGELPDDPTVTLMRAMLADPIYEERPCNDNRRTWDMTHELATRYGNNWHKDREACLRKHIEWYKTPKLAVGGF